VVNSGKKNFLTSLVQQDVDLLFTLFKKSKKEKRGEQRHAKSLRDYNNSSYLQPSGKNRGDGKKGNDP